MMETEIEAKFLSVNFVEVRQKLKLIGAVREYSMHQMKRAIIDYPDERMQKDRNAYIRVRDEGEKVTLTYKQFTSLSIDGAKEIETTVGSFDTVIQIFNEIGFKVRSFQESRREAWKFGTVEIVLDEWPWLNPYLEIEGSTKEAVKEVADKLGFKWDKAVFGDVMAAYRSQYPHLKEKDTVASLPEVRFTMAPPPLLQP